VIHLFGGPVEIWVAPRRKIGRHGRLLTIALTIAAAVLSGCGDDGGAEAGGGGTIAANTDTQLPTPPADGQREPILIKTRIKMFTGEVLAGSVIGDSPFCPGGTVRHEHGSPEIGFPAVNVFGCPDGQLKIGFGPGPDQMNNAVQTSDWKILDGSGSFTGVSGHGHMTVRWERAGSSNGQEAFTGVIVLP